MSICKHNGLIRSNSTAHIEFPTPFPGLLHFTRGVTCRMHNKQEREQDTRTVMASIVLLSRFFLYFFQSLFLTFRDFLAPIDCTTVASDGSVRAIE